MSERKTFQRHCTRLPVHQQVLESAGDTRSQHRALEEHSAMQPAMYNDQRQTQKVRTTRNTRAHGRTICGPRSTSHHSHHHIHATKSYQYLTTGTLPLQHTLLSVPALLHEDRAVLDLEPGHMSTDAIHTLPSIIRKK